MQFVLRVVLLGALSCASTRAPGSSSPPAELVLTGARIYTMDPAAPGAVANTVADTVADTVAIGGGRIVHVGSRASVQPFIGPDTRVEDLGGRTVLPGLHDSHTHLVWSATELEGVRLTDATTIEELLARIAARAAATGDGSWIRGVGWDGSRFEGKLSRALIDAIEPDRPVYMTSADGHSAWVNSAALARAGITATTPDPPNGRIERGPDGNPTGILREAAMARVASKLPPYDHAQVDAGLAKALAEAASHGITSIVDADAEDWMLAGYNRFAKHGRLTVRVHAAVEVAPARDLASQRATIEALRARHDSALVRVNAVKLYVDGVIESRTAYMLEPYVDGSNGTPNFTDAALAEAAIVFDRAGFQLHAHVIGDGAVRQMLDAIARTRQVNGPRDRRPLLSHVQVVAPADIPRFGALDVYANFQPLWAYPDPYITELTIPVIGPARARWLYPIRAVHEAGAVLVAGSDWSVSDMDPFDAMEVAVTRQAPETGAERGPGGETAAALVPEQRVALQEILAAYTIHGARASFVEDELGSITAGKRADLIVIDRDPFAIDPHELSEVRVLRTLLDGYEVYRAPAARGSSDGS